MSQETGQSIPNIVSPVRQSERLQQRAQRILRKQAQQRAHSNIESIPKGKEDNPDPPDDISALSTNSFDSINNTNMSSQQPKGILQKMLGEEFMVPIPSPNVTQAQVI